jgi:hypothetical protein
VPEAALPEQRRPARVQAHRERDGQQQRSQEHEDQQGDDDLTDPCRDLGRAVTAFETLVVGGCEVMRLHGGYAATRADWPGWKV